MTYVTCICVRCPPTTLCCALLASMQSTLPTSATLDLPHSLLPYRIRISVLFALGVALSALHTSTFSSPPYRTEANSRKGS